MRKNLIPEIAVLVGTLALSPTTFANDKEVTITGEGQCAKCALHVATSCQNTITMNENGKKVIYYLTQNDVSKEFHDQICKAPAQVTATGEAKEVHGRMELTPTKIALAK